MNIILLKIGIQEVLILKNIIQEIIFVVMEPLQQVQPHRLLMRNLIFKFHMLQILKINI